MIVYKEIVYIPGDAPFAMPDEQHLGRLFSDCVAFMGQVREPKFAKRTHDGATSALWHALWAASQVMHELALPRNTRIVGLYTELLHDVREDSDISKHQFDDYCRQRFDCGRWVAGYVDTMTHKSFLLQAKAYYGGTAGPLTKLFTLYDKVSNLMDGTWMSVELLSEYLRFVEWLLDEVSRDYAEIAGSLWIIPFARAVVERRRIEVELAK